MQLTSQVGDRGEDAASDDIAFDLGEPEFDLVKPRGVGGCEMEGNPRMVGQKLTHQIGLMGRQIVQDDVNLLVPGAQRDDFLEEGDEVAAGVASRGLTVNPARGSVQGRVQRQRPMAVVLEPMAFSTSRRERQNRIQAIQRLDGGLLIHTEHGRVPGRIHVQPNDIGGFGFKIRIVTSHVTLQPMRFQAGFFPGAMHGIFADTQGRCQFATTPARRSVSGLLTVRRQDFRPQPWGQHGAD